MNNKKLICTILGASIIASSIVSFNLGCVSHDNSIENWNFITSISSIVICDFILYFVACISLAFGEEYIKTENEETMCDAQNALSDDECKLKKYDDNNRVEKTEPSFSGFMMNTKVNEMLSKHILIHLGCSKTLTINNFQKFAREVSMLSDSEIKQFLEVIRNNNKLESAYEYVERVVLECATCHMSIGVYSDIEELFKAFYVHNIFGIKIINHNGCIKYYIYYQDNIDYKYDCERKYRDVIRYERIEIHRKGFLIVLEYAFTKGYIIQDSFRFKYASDFSKYDRDDIYDFCETKLNMGAVERSWCIDDFEKIMECSLVEICEQHEEKRRAEVEGYEYS